MRALVVDLGMTRLLSLTAAQGVLESLLVSHRAAVAAKQFLES